MKETQNIEWKASWHNDYFKWICGFANAQGGTLVIGKDDDGNVKHIENAKKLLEDIPNHYCPIKNKEQLISRSQ